VFPGFEMSLFCMKSPPIQLLDIDSASDEIRITQCWRYVFCSTIYIQKIGRELAMVQTSGPNFKMTRHSGNGAPSSGKE
jgi:hypothetical protein